MYMMYYLPMTLAVSYADDSLEPKPVVIELLAFIVVVLALVLCIPVSVLFVIFCGAGASVSTVFLFKERIISQITCFKSS